MSLGLGIGLAWSPPPYEAVAEAPIPPLDSGMFGRMIWGTVWHRCAVLALVLLGKPWLVLFR